MNGDLFTSGFIVVFEDNLTKEEATAIRSALAQIKGVIAIRPVEANLDTQIGRLRARHELAKALQDMLREP